MIFGRGFGIGCKTELLVFRHELGARSEAIGLKMRRGKDNEKEFWRWNNTVANCYRANSSLFLHGLSPSASRTGFSTIGMKTLIGLKFKEDDREADSDRKEQGSELMSSGETAVNLAFVFGKIEADVGHAERAEERQACMLAPENEGIISRECDCRFLTEIDTGYLPRAAQTDSEILGTMLGGRQEMTPRGGPL